MTIDDIARMAKEAGFEFNSLGATYTSGALPDLLEHFADLIAAAEREACAAVCEEYMEISEINTPMAIAAGNCADMIRARGK